MLRLETRSPNEFVVVAPERSLLALPLATAAVAITGIVLIIPMPGALRLVVAVVVVTATALAIRRPRADLWLQRPLRGAPTHVAARVELQGAAAVAVAHVRISRMSGGATEVLQTLQLPIERRGATSIVRFDLEPSENPLAIDVVAGRLIYRFVARS